MLNSNLAAILVFGGLLAICLIGLFASNAASERWSNRRRVDAADDLRSASGRSTGELR